MVELKKYIREVQDFPKPGINYYDITTLLKDPRGLRETIDRFCWCFLDRHIDVVVGMESRGFLFGPVVAMSLNAGFVPVRKPGKLPAAKRQVEYSLEYGNDILEMHEDAVEPGQRVLIVDDLIATGGTARATAELIGEMGGDVVGFGFIIELLFLSGRKRLEEFGEIVSLVQYEA